MALLEHIEEPADLRALTHAQLGTLAEEIRAFLVRHVARTGGHLGPNLGVVELTLALHRCFDSPRDTLLWDVGHQAYVHKIVTGRTAGFARLRHRGGLSGYPSRAESAHDHIEHSHASMALSYADGMAKARQLAGETGRHIVAVVGDGALTGGPAWEALNNIAAAPDRPLVIVLNDNGRSYAPTVGGLARHLSALRTHARFERLADLGRQALGSTGAPGRTLRRAMRATRQGIQDALAPRTLFAELGLAYLGPVDGHDIPALEEALEHAKEQRCRWSSTAPPARAWATGRPRRTRPTTFTASGRSTRPPAPRCGPAGSPGPAPSGANWPRWPPSRRRRWPSRPRCPARSG
jgi:1-deoxy-D-xylulose-5-phosphate synthase